MRILLTKGNRLFTGAWVLFVLAAIGHSTGTLPDEPAVNEAATAMEQAVFATGTPFEPTLMDVFRGAWLEVGVLMLGVALLNLAMMAITRGNARVKAALILIDLAMFAPLTAVFYIYPVPPPLIVFGTMTLLLGVDLIGSLRGRAAAPVPA